MEWVKFYSTSDWGCGRELGKSMEVIKSFEYDKTDYGINEIIQFYNITKYNDNKLFLLNWSKDGIENFRIISNEMKKIVFKFFKTMIKSDNISNYYKETEYRYREDFFELFSMCINDIAIEESDFMYFINQEKVNLHLLLENKEIVIKYDKVISQYFSSNDKHAEVLIQKYIEKSNNYNNLNIPKSMDNERKESLIVRYLKNEKMPRYAEIISQVQSNKDKIEISDKTRLLAKKRSMEVSEHVLEHGSTIDMGIEVRFTKALNEPFLFRAEKFNTFYEYNEEWFDENKDFSTILNNFIHIFGYVDGQCRIALTKKDYLSGIFERTIGIKVQNSYSPNYAFWHVEKLSEMQMHLYYSRLIKLGIRLESVIEWFFIEYLQEEFGIENYHINMPEKDSIAFEKCKTIISEFDYILKQYKCLVLDKNIDQELIQISSEHMFFKDTPSIVNRKNIYWHSEDKEYVEHYFFSDQSGLFMIDESEKYKNFYEFIINEDMQKKDFPTYDHNDIDWLVENNYLYENDDKYLKIKDRIEMKIYSELHHEGSLNYWRCNRKVRDKIDELIKLETLYSEDTLFTRKEQDYFNFYLNKSQFIDGLDLRNSYSHGNQPGKKDEKIHIHKYIIFLKLLVLIIIKINDEMCIINEEGYKPQ